MIQEDFACSGKQIIAQENPFNTQLLFSVIQSRSNGIKRDAMIATQSAEYMGFNEIEERETATDLIRRSQ